MRLMTLGGLVLEGSTLTRPTLLLMLAYLALEGPQARRHLAQLFWPGIRRGLRNLSMTLSRLEKEAPGVIEAGKIRVAARVTTDYGEVLELLSLGNLVGALDAYQGPFLGGVRVAGGVELEEWVYEKRESVATQLRQALLDKAERIASKGQFERAASDAEMAFKLAGAPALEPGELTRLYALMLAGGNHNAGGLAKEAKELSLTLPRTPQEAKEELQKLFAASVPPPSPLPLRDNPLIGRERELAEVAALLSRYRLLTLVGPAGVGKTSLALELAREAQGHFRDGVFFVALAALPDPMLVASSIAQALNVTESHEVPILERLKDLLQDKRLLLVLDNFEHLVSAAAVVGELLANSETLKVLVTSRTPLHLSSEREYPLLPLALPNPNDLPPAEQLLTFPAVALFVERAQAVKPDFAATEENAKAVMEICRRLDGLPLALELAAARIKLFTPQALLERLESRLELLKTAVQDKPKRHQTLRGAIAWSYDLLNQDEQSVFRRCAVFVGSFTLEAAGQVCGHQEPLDAVAALVDKSLLRPVAEARFAMLQTIRDYGLERLTLAGELASIQQAHFLYFLTLAERAEPELTGPQQASWLDTLEADHDNLRAALVWVQAEKEAELGLRLGSALWRFWIVRGYMREGRKHLEKLLRMHEGAITYYRAKALNGLGTLIFEMGDFGQARAVFEEAIETWRALDEPVEMATVLNNLGWITTQLGDFLQGRLLSEEALAISQSLGDQRGEAGSLANLGNLAMYHGRFKQACNLFGESLVLRRRLKDQRGTAYALANLAWAERYLGRYAEAEALLEEALLNVTQLNDKQITAWVLIHQGGIASSRGNLSKARHLLEEGVSLWREVDNKEGLGFTLKELSDVMRERGEYAGAATCLAEALAIWQEITHPWALAGTLWSLGQLALAEGNNERALGHFKESLSLRKKLEDEHGVTECLEAIALVAHRQKQSGSKGYP